MVEALPHSSTAVRCGSRCIPVGNPHNHLVRDAHGHIRTVVCGGGNSSERESVQSNTRSASSSISGAVSSITWMDEAAVSLPTAGCGERNGVDLPVTI